MDLRLSALPFLIFFIDYVKPELFDPVQVIRSETFLKFFPGHTAVFSGSKDLPYNFETVINHYSHLFLLLKAAAQNRVAAF